MMMVRGEKLQENLLSAELECALSNLEVEFHQKSLPKILTFFSVKDFGCYECTIKAVLAEVEREWLCSPSYVTMSIDGSSSDRSTCFRAGQPRMLLHL